MQNNELNWAWGQLKDSLRKGSKLEICLTFELLDKVPQLMDSGGLQAENMDWNMTPGLFTRMPGLPTMIVRPLVRKMVQGTLNAVGTNPGE